MTSDFELQKFKNLSVRFGILKITLQRIERCVVRGTVNCLTDLEFPGRGALNQNFAPKALKSTDFLKQTFHDPVFHDALTKTKIQKSVYND